MVAGAAVGLGVSPQLFDPGWNNGDDPIKTGPEGFDPDRVCIVHLEFLPDMTVQANEVHQDAVKQPRNDYDSNKFNIIDTINKLNSHTPLDKSHDWYHNIDELSFGSAHHVIFYVKNKFVEFDPTYPLWFGGKTQNNHSSRADGMADKNEAFYDRKIYKESNIIGAVGAEIPCQQLLYVKNYFTTSNIFGCHKKIGKSERIFYSLNLNLTVPEDGTSGSRVPIIVDPDTGNMGTGGHR